MAAAYPVVRRLVDPRFFAYAANEFIRAHPPRRPSLAEYGGDFVDFLAVFGPCRDLTYLPDVARLERTLAGLARAVARPALSSQALAGFGADEVERLNFTLQPTLALCASRFPIDAIWRANQADAVDETVDLGAGAVHIEARRQTGGIVLRRLDAATFAFRAEIVSGNALGQATEAALGRDPAFDLGGALADLFRDGAVVALTPPSRKETSP